MVQVVEDNQEAAATRPVLALGAAQAAVIQEQHQGIRGALQQHMGIFGNG